MLLKAYNYQDVEAAVAKANGRFLDDLKAGSNPDLRVYAAQGKNPYREGTGHVFAHVDTYTQRLPSKDAAMTLIRTKQVEKKSRWQNRRTALSACMELLNGDQMVRKWLKDFDTAGSKASRRPDPIDIKDRPVAGDYYGYAINEKVLKKVTKAAINIYAVGGELIIYSTYPTVLCEFQEPDLDLGSLFGDSSTDVPKPAVQSSLNPQATVFVPR
jgi:hypothetical protein